MGAIIGGIVGLTVYLIQNARKKKMENNDTLDADIKEEKEL